MKTTILTIALGLASLPLTFAQAPAAPATPATPAASADKPVATTPAKATKKHHKKAVKTTAKTPASTTPAPAKQ